MTEFVDLISNVGFPIAACICLFIMLYKQTEVQHQQMEVQHQQALQLEGMKESLDRNTEVMNKLIDKLGDDTK